MDSSSSSSPLLANEEFLVPIDSVMHYYSKVRLQLESHVPELGEYRKNLARFVVTSKTWLAMTTENRYTSKDTRAFFADIVTLDHFLHLEELINGAHLQQKPPAGFTKIKIIDMLCAMYFVEHYQSTRPREDHANALANLIAGKKKDKGQDESSDPYEGLRFDEQWQVKLENPQAHASPSPTPGILAAAIDGSLFLRPNRAPAFFDAFFFSANGSYALLTHELRLQSAQSGKMAAVPHVYVMEREMYVSADLRAGLKYIRSLLDNARIVSKSTQGENY